eukprot:9377017-Alexandrium_andersonii.AAC.1
MSASLVGSEMCIRDRRSTLHAHLRGATAAGVSPTRHPVHTRSTRGICTCLLYTSDAADDM